VSLNATRRLFVVDFLDYSEDKKAKKDGEKKSEESLKSQEEKKKHIKSLIEKIPTEKDALFAYQLDWTAIDNNLMERKIRLGSTKKLSNTSANRNPLWSISFVPKFWPGHSHRSFYKTSKW
jgi:hypothetical protein